MKELAALLCVLLVAGGIVFAMTRTGTGPSTFDTFSGRVDKIPLQILSPVAGQVLTLPGWEGASVQQGEVLARIQVLDRNFRPPAGSGMFTLQGDVLQVLSPSSGMIAKLAIAPLSAVSGNELLLQLYTIESTELHVLVPRENPLAGYRAFYMSAARNSTRFRIRMAGAVPVEVVSDIPATMAVYRATCDHPPDCQTLLTKLQVLVYAMKSGR
jgi:hypothetical protein